MVHFHLPGNHLSKDLSIGLLKVQFVGLIGKHIFIVSKVDINNLSNFVRWCI